MPRANLLVRGQSCLWSIDTDLSDEEIEAMREDGVPLGILVHDEPFEPTCEWFDVRRERAERRRR